MSTGALAPHPIRLGGDSKRGWPAVKHARACADLLACVRSLPFAIVTFHTGGTVLAYNGMNGIGLSHAPTVTLAGVGMADVEWQPQYLDPWGNSYPVSIHHCETTPRHHRHYVTWEITAPNKVRVHIYTAAAVKSSHSLTLAVF